jgi:pimeloyl-ACP methyl ester carboxylesterase
MGRALPFATNSSVRIYYEVEGTGPPLILAHGLSATAEDWRDFGYVAALKDAFTLLLVDARGHGRSEKPHEPESYSRLDRAADFVAVLDAERIERAHVWGYSMGGILAFALMHVAPHRLDRVVIGGASIYPPADPSKGVPVTEILNGGTGRLIEYLEKDGGFAMSAAQRGRYESSDMTAIAALVQGPAPVDNIAEAVKSFRRPCLLYAGSKDPLHPAAKQTAGVMPAAEFVSVPGETHVGAMCRGAAIMRKPVTEFLALVPA